jgi:hypothetical protein
MASAEIITVTRCAVRGGVSTERWSSSFIRAICQRIVARLPEFLKLHAACAGLRTFSSRAHSSAGYSPNRPLSTQSCHSLQATATGRNAPKQPPVAGNRNGEKCRGTRRAADPT